MAIKAVIFDLDDTLVPEKAFVKSGYHAVAAKLAGDVKRLVEFLGGDMPDATEDFAARLWALFQEDSRNVFNRFVEELQIDSDESYIQELVKIYREHVPDPEIYRVYEDVVPAMRSLRRQGIRIGVLSDGFAVSQRNKLDAIVPALQDALGEEQIFDGIVLTDELGREHWKPDPEGFLRLAEAFALDPSEMVYVGDNPKKDFLIGKALPMKTIRVLRPGSVYENAGYAEDVKESAAVDYLTELPYVIREL